MIEGAPYIDPAELSSDEAVEGKAKDDAHQAAWDYLNARRSAFQRFKADNMAPGDAALIIADLRKFCRGGVSTYYPNERDHVLMTGRNEVWLRFQEYMSLTMDELFVERTTQREPL